jgi:hypothetical protein
MRTRTGLALATAAATLLAAAPVMAQPAPVASDLASIQQQLNTLRSEYDAKIADLEARLKAAEARASGGSAPGEVIIAETAPPPALNAGASPPDPNGGEVIIADSGPTPGVGPALSAAGSAMNPGISVVLNGNYVADRRDPSEIGIAGYPLGDDAGLKPRGFSIDESEITLAANVDPYLLANITVSFGADNQPSVEEAYIQSTALPAGLTVRAGRFFSAIGYLNERHAHNWSFIDMPLPYRALLGGQYGDDGVQVRWLAPTPFFMELGAEAYRGDSFPGGGNDKNRAGTQTGFVHTGGDFNDSSSWLAALSYIHTDANGRVTEGPSGPDAFSGSDGIAIASLVYKWAPGGNLVQRNLVLSGEYFSGRQSGTFNGLRVNRDPSGWYAQGVYTFAKRWSAGLRYASLEGQGVRRALAGSALDGFGHTPSTLTGLVEYDPSEFSRFRIQFTRDTSDARLRNDELMMQYTVVFGPHGAHRY